MKTEIFIEKPMTRNEIAAKYGITSKTLMRKLVLNNVPLPREWHISIPNIQRIVDALGPWEGTIHTDEI